MKRGHSQEADRASKAAHLALRRLAHTALSLALVASISLAAAAVASGRSLSPGAGASARGIAVPALAGTGAVEGTVTSAATGEPLEGIEVCALEEKLKPVSLCATTSSGQYAITGLEPGEYWVRFSVPSASSLNYATQFYRDRVSPPLKGGVPVIAEAITPGVNAALVEGGTVAGTVTSTATKEPLADIEVCASSVIAASDRCTSTNALGQFAISSLSAASYVVKFVSGGEYQTKFEPVSMIEPGGTDTIEVKLGPAVPHNEGPPKISGSAVEGQTLSVVHGAWTNKPESYTEVWKRCDGAGDTASCMEVGEGESYTLTTADVGHTIRVWEMAHNGGGESICVFSEPTSAVVTATQPQTSGSGSPPPPPNNAANGEVLHSITAVVSVADLRSMLRGLLAPSGKGGKIGLLLEHGAYSISFHALEAGLLKVAWYLVPKGAHLASPKPTLAAVGQLSVAGAGTVELKIKLTNKGKGLLKHASRLKLTSQGTFTPTGQAAVTNTTQFTLKR